MLPETDFIDQVGDAYAHLYDLAYLRTHALLDRVLLASSVADKERAWQLHNLLLEAIAKLEPGPQVPVFSRPWRRYQLMVLRYIQALDRVAVMKELGISRRHYYREHKIAIEGLAAILWERHLAPPPPPPAPEAPLQPAGVDHLELLRIEAARVSHAHRYARLDTVVEGTLCLLRAMLEQRAITIRGELAGDLPLVDVNGSLLRQVVLGLLAYLVEGTREATLSLAAQTEPAGVRLIMQIEPPTAVSELRASDNPEPLASLGEMLALSGAEIRPRRLGSVMTGFEVHLPGARHTVMVVDDNADMLELFRRYLSSHGYHIVTAQTAEEALSLAKQVRPYAITLDLMMPDQDGWDLLQVLQNQADTSAIPILVCSVLKQKQLALSLGATAFLEKPITEEALLSALGALGEH